MNEGEICMGIKLTVFFEDPFWVGVFERSDGGRYETARVVFGSEPKDHEVQELVLQKFIKLRFTRPIINDELVEEKRINPKRLLRQVHREVETRGVGTKAQQALKLEYEVRKKENKAVARENKEAAEAKKFEMRQQKKKEKKKGH
jgi:hypothetical protein